MEIDCDKLNECSNILYFKQGEFREKTQNNAILKYDIFSKKNYDIFSKENYLGYFNIHSSFDKSIMLYGLFLEKSPKGTGHEFLKSLSIYAKNKSIEKVVLAGMSAELSKKEYENGSIIELNREARESIFRHIGKKLINEGILKEVNESKLINSLEYIINQE
jgi:hypothetical protein